MPSSFTRRAVLGSTAALAASPAVAQGCLVGPPPHQKGARVFLDYDQVELDASYDQNAYEPLGPQTYARLVSNSEEVRARLGEPRRASYGATDIEQLDIFRTDRPRAPIFIFIHGGNWTGQVAFNLGYAAEMFTRSGAHYVVPDFANVNDVGGDLGVLAAQVRRAIAWTYKNAATLGGDPDRIYIAGHSSGGHLCGVALTTDWREFGVPQTSIKGGLCISGMFDMKPVRLSWRRTYVNFTDAMEDSMSAQRHIDKITAPVTVTYGTLETPEFQRQSRDFAAALRAAGKRVELIEARNYTHSAMCESLGNPYGAVGRAALALMNLGPA